MENYWYIFHGEIHLYNLTSKILISLWKRTHCGHFISSKIYQSHPANLIQVFLFSESRDHRPQTVLNSTGFLPFKKIHSQGWHANQSHNTCSNAVWTASANNKWLRYPNYWYFRAHKKRQRERAQPGSSSSSFHTMPAKAADSTATFNCWPS